MRHINETRTLWIDALCINQNDERDKTDQVKVMAQIYENASRTLVWLGPTSSCSPIALVIIQQVSFGFCFYVYTFPLNDTYRLLK